MIFVCGIQGVGKIQYCRQLSRKIGKPYFPAGEPIPKNELDADFISDGHLCFLNERHEIRQVEEKKIRTLRIKLLIILVDKPLMIKRKLEQRDKTVWEESFIEYFQKRELEYALRLGQNLGLDYKIVTNNNESESYFGKSILLPIKPLYAEKIFMGEKKYEFRKKLCTENIDKIYFYATSPVKKIVGEADVLEKYSMEKKRLWNLTYSHSGISADFFEQYFQTHTRANAYKLGKSTRYASPFTLGEIGLNYTPQSYAYINTDIMNRSM